MKTVTLEADGRVAIPQDVRDELGLVEGENLALEISNGRLVLGPVRARLVRKGHALVLRGARVEAGVDLTAQTREARDRVAIGLWT